MLLNYHIGRFVLSSLCVGDLVHLGLSSARVAGWSTATRALLKPTTQLTLILLTWRIWWAPNNASRWQMGFNSAFKGLMSETCWVHKKWNKIESDIKLVFYSSTITVMHGPINIRTRRVLKLDKSGKRKEYIFVLPLCIWCLRSVKGKYFTVPSL